MTDNELKEIREKISCPQLGDDHYGEWGILTQRQRFTIKRMLDYIEAQETFIICQKAEIERLEEKNSNLTSDLTSLQNDLSSAMAEIENLKTACAENKVRTVTHNFIKAEAYKEFAKEVNKELFGEEYQLDKVHRRAVERILNRLTSKE